MAKVELEAHGAVAVIRLSDGVINPISPEMVRDLEAALNEVRAQFRGLVLAGGPKFFSMGFNLPQLLNENREGMARFFYAFNDLWIRLYSLPLPTVCAARGHAVAGGCILGLGCDFRVSAREKARWGLNESRLGVSVPYGTDLALRQAIGQRQGRELLYTGRLVGPDEALALGLVDELADHAKVEERALALAADLAALPQGAYAAIKENQTEELLALHEARHPEKHERFLDLWCGEAAQKQLAAAAEKF